MISIKENINISTFQLILICLIPLGLIFSRFFADFFLVVVCLIFAFRSFLEKNYFYKHIFFKIFLLFWLLISVRSLFSEDLFFSLKPSVTYIRFGLFAFAIYYLFKMNTKFSLYLFLSISFVLIILVFDGFVQYFLGKNIIGYPITTYLDNDNIRLSSFFKEELVLGSFISRIFPLYLGLYFFCVLNNFFKKKDYVMFIFLLLSTFLVLLSGERVAFLYMFLTFLLGLYFLKLPIKKFINKIIIGLIILISIISLNKDVKNRFIESTFYQIGITQNAIEKTEKGEKYIYSIHHHNHIIAAYKIFKENMIFGSGVKMFRKVCDERYNINPFSCSTHPHNTIMQFLSETGIIGIMFYLVSLTYILNSILKNFKILRIDKDNNLVKAKLSFLIAIIIPLIPLIPSGNFFNNWISIISYFPVGFYLLTESKNYEY